MEKMCMTKNNKRAKHGVYRLVNSVALKLNNFLFFPDLKHIITYTCTWWICNINIKIIFINWLKMNNFHIISEHFKFLPQKVLFGKLFFINMLKFTLSCMQQIPKTCKLFSFFCNTTICSHANHLSTYIYRQSLPINVQSYVIFIWWWWFSH